MLGLSVFTCQGLAQALEHARSQCFHVFTWIFGAKCDHCCFHGHTVFSWPMAPSDHGPGFRDQKVSQVWRRRGENFTSSSSSCSFPGWPRDPCVLSWGGAAQGGPIAIHRREREYLHGGNTWFNEHLHSLDVEGGLRWPLGTCGTPHSATGQLPDPTRQGGPTEPGTIHQAPGS